MRLIAIPDSKVLPTSCSSPASSQHKQHIHHKHCRGGGVEQLKCVRCNKLFATVRARAAHETGCRFCRWCDRVFRSAANRARHEQLCLDRPDADVVAE